jgi:hypothetical protein
MASVTTVGAGPSATVFPGRQAPSAIARTGMHGEIESFFMVERVRS